MHGTRYQMCLAPLFLIITTNNNVCIYLEVGETYGFQCIIDHCVCPEVIGNCVFGVVVHTGLMSHFLVHLSCSH